MQRLRDTNPALRDGWRIVKRACVHALIPRVHRLSDEETKNKMEDLIQDTVRKTMDGELRADRFVEVCNDKTINSQQIQERTIEMIEFKKDKYALKPNDENKLQTASDKLVQANGMLNLLLVEADVEPIKENSPEAARAKCWEAWHKGRNTSLRIQHIILKKRSLNLVDDLSAVEEAVKNTEAKRKMLQAILDLVIQAHVG